MYRLYVIPGSHACRAAMLMLEHQQVPYRRVDVVTLLHPIVVRLHGFDAGGQTRTAGARRTVGLRMGDRLGTVPALAADGHRVSTNHRIARFLDERHPEPPLFPADPERRSAVEECRAVGERHASDGRPADRVAGDGARPAGFSRSTGDGRLGYLLYRRALTRRVIIPRIRGVFAASSRANCELLADLPATLDRIDAWIASGVVGGAQLNAADFMVVPSLALILYRSDLLPKFEGRPTLELVDRLLPEPA